MNIPISAIEWLRPLLICAHLLLSMQALALVLWADIGLVSGRLSRRALHATVRWTTTLLASLWMTGLAIVWLDTAFDPAMLAERPKLLLKLTAVSVLTFNGLVLHRLSFPVLLAEGPLGGRAAALLAVTGSLSTLHWLVAAFVGLTKPLGRLPLELLLGGYAGLCASVALGSLLCVPLVRRHVRRWRHRQRSGLIDAGFGPVAIDRRRLPTLSPWSPPSPAPRAGRGGGNGGRHSRAGGMRSSSGRAATLDRSPR